MVEPSQTIHLKGKEDDPVVMWEQLKSVHLQQRPGARFNAYDDLFSIRKLEEESLQSLVTEPDLMRLVSSVQSQSIDQSVPVQRRTGTTESGPVFSSISRSTN